MTAPWLADVLADAFRGVKGFRVDTYPGWPKRSAKTTFFAPEGVMDHHTGPGSYNGLLAYMAENSSIAPLCNYATSRPSSSIVRITVVAAGRANHAGAGELPWRKGQGSTGNARTVGAEHQNDGKQAWPDQQVEAMRRCDAAVLGHLGAKTNRMLDHKTYAPGRKVDRHTLSVAVERVAVGRLMKGTNVRASLVQELEKLTDEQAALLVKEVRALSNIKEADGGPAQGSSTAWMLRFIRRLRDLDGGHS